MKFQKLTWLPSLKMGLHQSPDCNYICHILLVLQPALLDIIKLLLCTNLIFQIYYLAPLESFFWSSPHPEPCTSSPAGRPHLPQSIPTIAREETSNWYCYDHRYWHIEADHKVIKTQAYDKSTYHSMYRSTHAKLPSNDFSWSQKVSQPAYNS